MSELWQPWENLFLHEVGRTMPVHVIAEKLERSEPAITRQASRIGAPLISKMSGRAWTPAELHLFGRFSEEEIAKATGRSIYSVRSKRNALACCIEEVGDKRLAVNIERNGWDVRNPEQEDS